MTIIFGTTLGEAQAGEVVYVAYDGNVNFHGYYLRTPAFKFFDEHSLGSASISDFVRDEYLHWVNSPNWLRIKNRLHLT